jgi:hypothetical protein
LVDSHLKKKENIVKVHEKVENYARYVKEMYWPKVSEEKK